MAGEAGRDGGGLQSKLVTVNVRQKSEGEEKNDQEVKNTKKQLNPGIEEKEKS